MENNFFDRNMNFIIGIIILILITVGGIFIVYYPQQHFQILKEASGYLPDASFILLNDSKISEVLGSSPGNFDLDAFVDSLCKTTVGNYFNNSKDIVPLNSAMNNYSGSQITSVKNQQINLGLDCFYSHVDKHLSDGSVTQTKKEIYFKTAFFDIPEFNESKINFQTITKNGKSERFLLNGNYYWGANVKIGTKVDSLSYQSNECSPEHSSCVSNCILEKENNDQNYLKCLHQCDKFCVKNISSSAFSEKFLNANAECVSENSKIIQDSKLAYKNKTSCSKWTLGNFTVIRQ